MQFYILYTTEKRNFLKTSTWDLWWTTQCRIKTDV